MAPFLITRFLTPLASTPLTAAADSNVNWNPARLMQTLSTTTVRAAPDVPAKVMLFLKQWHPLPDRTSPDGGMVYSGVHSDWVPTRAVREVSAVETEVIAFMLEVTPAMIEVTALDIPLWMTDVFERLIEQTIRRAVMPPRTKIRTIHVATVSSVVYPDREAGDPFSPSRSGPLSSVPSTPYLLRAPPEELIFQYRKNEAWVVFLWVFDL
jgi:hypothetical protein